MKYVYSPFQWEPGLSGFYTNVVGVGVLAVRCLCSEVFIKNLDIYPEENYYDETAWRFGFVIRHTVRRDKFEAYLDWILLDQIMIASWNNPGMRKYPFDYWSAGLGVAIFRSGEIFLGRSLQPSVEQSLPSAFALYQAQTNHNQLNCASFLYLRRL